MKIKSSYCKNFYSDRLSKTKHKEIYSLAQLLLTQKNYLSTIVNNNLFFYLKLKKHEFQKETLPLLKGKVNSHFVKALQDDVYTTYTNKFEVIKNKIRFNTIKHEVSYYKKNTTKHKVGDVKSINKKIKTTPLTITLTYLAKSNLANPVEYIKSKLATTKNKDQQDFCNTILLHIEKFSLERLQNLALSKRNRMINSHLNNPIVFKSLTFRGRSRLTEDIVSYNTNFNSSIKAFINISWGFNNRKKMTIPIKFSKKYHLDMTRYTNNTDTSYTLSFEKNKQVRIILSFEDERIIPESKFKLIGIDVNSKHNLLQCSNGDYIDFDRVLIKCLSKELLKIDKLKSKNQNYVIGKRKDKKINHLIRELQSKIREQMAFLCKRLNTLGINHVVLENLTGFQRKAICKDENNLNYNRRLTILKLSSLKNEFEHIARKYDIAISFVHPCYTSITCPKCGCIDKSNRKTQEVFKCVECNFTDNADVNAANNILNRVVSTELRDKLLKKSKLGNGTFEPKDLSKDEVKEILLSLRYSCSNRNKESGL